MDYLSAVICGPGKVRAQNQDNFYLNGIYRESVYDVGISNFNSIVSGSALYAVADGMGGEKHGELASLYAVQLLDAVDPIIGNPMLYNYLMNRNSDICDLILEQKGARSGTTFVGLSLSDNRADVINIGDSRAYLFRKGQMKQISKDHTSIRQMVDLGIITPEAARKHPDRHRLTQHLGIFPDEMIIEPYTVRGLIMPGDIFLLCSDGLYEMVDDIHIQTIVTSRKSVSERAQELYDAAMNAGGEDNITVLLVAVLEK